MAGLDTQPSATTYELEDLIAAAWQGKIRVPHFQRDFRWTSREVIQLFDSIVRGYPIGSLLLWVRHSPAARVILGQLTIEAPKADDCLWVVDGQQRVISLANALRSDIERLEPFDIFYDLSKQEFLSTPKTLEPHHIPLPVLFDLEALLDWFTENKSESDTYFTEARSVAKKLRQFKVPAYLVKQDDQKILTDIFDRMNNFGKRLSRAEIFSALFAGPEDGASDRLTIPKIAAQLAEATGFGVVDDGTVLHGILARRSPDTTRDPRPEFDGAPRRASDFPDEDQQTAYREGENALNRAIHFLQGEAGVPHLSLLPYSALLVILSRFFAHYPNPDPRNLQLLRRFYWRVAVSGPEKFGGSFTQLARSLAAKIKPGDQQGSIDRLLGSIDTNGHSVPSIERFRTNNATGKIILCAWWSLRPRSPLTGEPYSQVELSDVLTDQKTPKSALRRIIPDEGAIARQGRQAANRLFLPSPDESVTELIDAFSNPPERLDQAAWDAVLASHCLSRAVVELLTSGSTEEFIESRNRLIEGNLMDFLNRMAEWDREDTPPLSLLDLDDQPEDSGPEGWS